MADSKEGGKGPEIPRTVKPAVPPFRGPGTGGPSPLRPMDPNSRLTRPPFIPPMTPGRKPLTTPAAPARPSPTAPVGAASIPEIAVPPDRAHELVEAIRPMSSSTSTPPSTATSDSERPPADAGWPRMDQIESTAWATRDTASEGSTADSQLGEAPTAAAKESGESTAFVDPAPFVGIRPTEPGEVTQMSVSESPDPAFEFPMSDAVETPARESQKPSSIAASHPLARTLNELAVRIDNGDLEVASFEEGMSPEAALAATLAAMLKRAR